ncbi:hypothetical protein SprV_0401648000 [Sparganum proliferum]
MPKLTVVFLLVAAVYGILAQESLPWSSHRNVSDILQDLKAHVGKVLKEKLEEKQKAILLILVDAATDSNKTWEEHFASLFGGKSKQLVKDFIDTVQGEKNGTVVGFLKESIDDIVVEVLKTFGAKGNDLSQVFEYILEDAVLKFLAVYVDKLSGDELKALAAVFTGLVKTVIKVAMGSEKPGTAVLNYLRDEIGDFLKVYATSKLEKIREKVNQAAKETNKKLVRFSSDWLISYILRRGSRLG